MDSLSNISNQMFSFDSVKYVYQYPNPNAHVPIIYHNIPPVKPFEIKAPEKSKKDIDKRKEEGDKNQPSK